MIKNYYNKLVSFIKKYKLQPIVDVALFGIIIVFFHYIWWHGLKELLQNLAAFNQMEAWLAHQVFLPSAWIVKNIIGYDVTTANDTIYFGDYGYVAVLGSCSGLKQFYQWTMLMILFPGPWLKKLWYIPLGLLAIHGVNIFRIVTLSIVVETLPQHWDFIHLWILRPFYYVVIFAMWVIWVERVGRRGGEIMR